MISVYFTNMRAQAIATLILISSSDWYHFGNCSIDFVGEILLLRLALCNIYLIFMLIPSSRYDTAPQHIVIIPKHSIWIQLELVVLELQQCIRRIGQGGNSYTL